MLIIIFFLFILACYSGNIIFSLHYENATKLTKQTGFEPSIFTLSDDHSIDLPKSHLLEFHDFIDKIDHLFIVVFDFCIFVTDACI